MGEAILEAPDLIKLRKQQYQANGVAYYRRWIFLITDGGPYRRMDGSHHSGSRPGPLVKHPVLVGRSTLVIGRIEVDLGRPPAVEPHVEGGWPIWKAREVVAGDAHKDAIGIHGSEQAHAVYCARPPGTASRTKSLAGVDH